MARSSAEGSFMARFYARAKRRIRTPLPWLPRVPKRREMTKVDQRVMAPFRLQAFFLMHGLYWSVCRCGFVSPPTFREVAVPRRPAPSLTCGTSKVAVPRRPRPSFACGAAKVAEPRRPAPRLMCEASKIEIHVVGKSGGGWEDAAVQEYSKRLGGGSMPLKVETIFHKTDAQLERAVERTEDAVILDERGALLTSEEFADVLFERLEACSSRFAFVVGGADGLPPSLRGTPPLNKKKQSLDQSPRRALFSLGRLTLPHRIVRVLLVEQIYRAQEIKQGTKYHRGDPS